MSTEKPSYLALGDSYTIGESVSLNERWPVQLSEQTQWMPPQIIAKTGWTSSELISAIQHTTLAATYDWVSLLIGVNNQYRGQNIDFYEEDLQKLAKIMLPLVDHKPQRIFVLSIPDYSVTPFAIDNDPEKISSELLHFNQTNLRFVEKNGFQYCNITKSSLLAKDHPEYLADDGLHPSGLMYTLWIKEILSTINFSII